MNCAIIRCLTLIVLYVSSIHSQSSPMAFIGLRSFIFYTGYTGKPATQLTSCCLSNCVTHDYTFKIAYKIHTGKNGYVYSNKATGESKGQERIYIKTSVDYDRNYHFETRDLFFEAKALCKDEHKIQDRWHSMRLHFLPFNGSLYLDAQGDRNYMFLSFAIKGNCPGRAAHRCRIACNEDLEKYCDEFTGTFYCKNRRFGENCQFNIAACNRNPCFNGICENVGAGFVCHCHDGYSGITCKDTKCTPSNCKNGLCQNEKFCNCFDGYSGEHCETLALSVAFCSGRGTAKKSVDGSNYICECYDDASGANCEYSCGGICQNGGKCVTRRNSGYCECAPSYIGKNCELVEGQGVCAAINCQNGGTCENVGGQDFKCRCTELWYGSFCQISVCSTGYCYHGNCVDNAGCICFDGYSGKRCETVAVQTYKECKNGGVNSITLGFLRCDCDKSSTTGPFCEYTCSKRCLNGLCQWSNSIIKCVCNAGYSGDDCSILKDQSVCGKRPCLNGGKCEELQGGTFKCTCDEHWIGDLCEISTCQSNRCYRGTCMDGIGCLCFKGYKGKSCDEPVCPLDGSQCSKSDQCSIAGSRVFCNCDRQKYYGQKCESECQPTCSKNGVCGLVNGELKCICFANYKGQKCDELIVDPAYLYSIYGFSAAIIVLVVSSAFLIYFTMKHKMHFTAQAVKNALFDASDALGFTRTHKVLQVDDTYGAALQKGWAISSR